MSSDPIDALIDDTATEMTAGSPSSALREQVRARLTPPRHGWQAAIWQPVLGAAAMAAIGLALLWRSSAVPGVPVPARVEPPPAREIARAIDAPVVERVDAPAVARIALAAHQRAARDVRAAALPDDIKVEPLDIPPIPPSALETMERISVPAPLQIEQLVIAGLLAE